MTIRARADIDRIVFQATGPVESIRLARSELMADGYAIVREEYDYRLGVAVLSVEKLVIRGPGASPAPSGSVPELAGGPASP